MDSAIAEIHYGVIDYFVDSYVKYPDRLKEEGQYDPNAKNPLGGETPYKNNHVDRDGDNPAKLDQASTERIVRKMERIYWAAKALITQRSQVSADLPDFEQQQILQNNTVGGAVKAEFGSRSEAEKPVLYIKGKKVDTYEMGSNDYSNVERKDISGFSIPELRDFIDREIGKVEKLVPKDNCIRTRLRAIQAIANYEIETPVHDTDFGLFYCGVTPQEIAVIHQDTRMLITGDREYLKKSCANDSPMSQAQDSIGNRDHEVVERAVEKIIRAQERKYRHRDDGGPLL